MKKASFLRLSALALAVVMIVAFTVGCNPEGSKSIVGNKNYVVDLAKLTAKKQPMKEDQSDLEWKNDTSEFTFKMWIGVPSMRDVIGNINTEIGQEVSKRTGAKWEVEIPAGNESTVMQMMVAADTYPDVLVCPLNWGSLNQMVDGKKLLAMSDLMDQYAPKMWNLFDDQSLTWWTMPDGKMYYMPGFVTHDGSLGDSLQQTNAPNFYVRHDIYEAMGRPNMSTPETFKSTLERVKNEYPSVKPLCMGYVWLTDYSINAMRHFFQGFGVQPQGVGGDQPSLVYMEGDKVRLPFYDANYKKAVQYTNSLHRAGIITDSTLIQRQSQIDQDIHSANYFCFSEYTSNLNNIINPSVKTTFKGQTGFDGKVDSIYYEIMAPAFAAEGVTPQYPTLHSKGWMTSAITKNCKNPERMIKFMEFMWSDEGQRLQTLGIEGKHYNINEKGEFVPTDEVLEAQLGRNTQLSNKIGFSFSPFFLNKAAQVKYSAYYSGMKEDLVKDWTEMNKYATNLYAKGLGDIGPRQGSKEYIAYGRVQEQFMKNMLKMITAKTDADFDSMWSAAIKAAEKSGAAEVEANLTANHKWELSQLVTNK